ncbi:hypothetical protein DIURU_003063 [Diutina rugosa]|uniref:Autophagy-related protein 11 n=1 Tax=Diutina rugosa TaxID=5481 RepID=A0A642UU25_DIURU|nr:uncharacterized protein DIURU_003063 [Diutina rugosa]KAA8901814.1 hypothetical protein DIURU_003063 [Diutina rugosa]
MSSLTYLEVYNSHNGHHVRIPKPVRFHSVGEFKSFVASSFGIADDANLFLLTSFGIRLNYGLVNEVSDVYVFDRSIFAVTGSTPAPESALVGDEAPPPPSPPTDPRHQPGYAKTVYIDGQSIASAANDVVKQVNVMFTALNVIFQFGTNYTQEIDRKWFAPKLQEVRGLNDKTLAVSWSQHFSRLKKLPPVEIAPEEKLTLHQYLDSTQLADAANYSNTHLSGLIDHFNRMNRAYQSCLADNSDIDAEIAQLRQSSRQKFAHVDVDELVAQLAAAKDSGDAAKAYEAATAIYTHYQQARQFKQHLTTASAAIFRKIAQVQMKMVEIKQAVQQVGSLDQVKRGENLLSLTIDLPMLVGFMMIEQRRQFEWHDYFAGAIVSAVSEQLASVVEQERLFRRTWRRKFAPFLELFVDANHLDSSVPQVDISVGGGQPARMGLRVQVERKHITNYIAQLEYEPKFVEVLGREYRDLVSRNHHMAKMNRILSSFATVALDDDTSNWNDDAHLIKGLKSRIKKLESLLHQYQYKNLSSWPVSQRVAGSTSNGHSSRPTPSVQRTVSSPVTTMAASDERGTSAAAASALLANPKSDPVQLLKRHSLPMPSQQLDSSVIDKHLDNIRLRRSNEEVMTQNHELSAENAELKQQLAELKLKHAEEMEQMSGVFAREKQALVDKHEHTVTKLQRELGDAKAALEEARLDAKLDAKERASLEAKVESRDTRIRELEVAAATAAATTAATTTTEQESLEAYRAMNADLIANMTAKEQEFGRERSQLESEIRQLQGRLDEMSEDLSVVMGSQQPTEIVVDLNNLIISLASRLKRAVELIHSQFIEFCLVIESMGLLLVEDEEHRCRITRVKGLRAKKEDELDSPATEVAASVATLMESMARVDKFTSMAPSDQSWEAMKEHSLELIAEFNALFGPESAVDRVVSFLEFSDNVHLQDDSLDRRFFLNAVTRRFRDVEGFAKRQNKENKQKQQEVNRLVAKLSHKITISGFSVGDLVLFLPTRIDSQPQEAAPWAAFNVGAPHYFLDGGGDGEWMVGRVESIVEHKVTSENASSSDANPFALSVGVVWYMITATKQCG